MRSPDIATPVRRSGPAAVPCPTRRRDLNGDAARSSPMLRVNDVAPPSVAPPKTDASRRTIPLPKVVVAALAERLRQFRAGPDGFIFPDDHSEPIKRTSFSRDVWVPARTGAEIPDTVTM